MPHPVIHTEIRSKDPDATREFFAAMFDWKVASEGGPRRLQRSARSQ
jgi:predicted enzyme related to lactoylglutathione lyase